MPNPCSRRRALHLLGTVTPLGFAGCLSDASGSTGTPSAAEPASTPSPVDISFDVTVNQSFTADHPGRMTITLANHEDDPLVMGTAHGIEGPFSGIRLRRADTGAELVMFADPPTGEHQTPPGVPCRDDGHAIPETPTDGCWRPACEFAILHAHASVTVPAGETLAWPYVVLDRFNEPCLPAGSYAAAATSPVVRAPPTPTMGPTPPGGWSYRLTKRISLDLGPDGRLSATANHEMEPVG